MPGALDFIFGSAPEANSVAAPFSSRLDSRQKELQGTLFEFLNRNPSTILPTYDKPITAGLTPLQISSLSGLENLASQINSGKLPGQGIQNTAQNTINSLLTAKPQDTSDYFKTNVFDPLNREFTQNTLPTVLSALGQSVGGVHSTAADQAISRVTNDFASTLARAQSDIARNELARVDANRIPAIAAATQLGNDMNKTPLDLLLGVLSGAQIGQQTEDAALRAQYGEFARGQQNTQAIIDQMLRFIADPTQQRDPVAVTPGSTGLLGNILGTEFGAEKAFDAAAAALAFLGL